MTDAEKVTRLREVLVKIRREARKGSPNPDRIYTLADDAIFIIADAAMDDA